MPRVMNACLLWAAVAVVLFPAPARADGYVTPWIGINLSSPTDSGRSTFGATAGYMGAGIFGFEGDFGYSPDFLGSGPAVGSSNAFTVMGNFILGIPIGGDHGAGVRPFVSGGIGLLHTHIDGGALVGAQSTWEAGYNVGLGMMGFFSQHVGLRGEARYLHMLEDTNRRLGFDVDPGRLRFWRLSFGVTFR